MITHFALQTLQHVLNMALSLDPELPERLTSLDQKVLQLDITGTPLTFNITPCAGELQLSPASAATPDCTIRGSVFALTQLGLAQDFKQTRESLNNISIEGDLELAQDFKKLLAELNIDWEEGLSTIVGDIAANFLGNRVRGAYSWTQQSAQSLQMNITEFLQEEVLLLPPRAALEDFYDDVDTLQLTVERLAARIQQR